MSTYPVLPTYEEATQPAHNPNYNNQDGFPRHFHNVPNGIPTTVTSTHSTIVVSPVGFGPFPASTQCPYCSEHILTETIEKNGMFAWLLFIALLFFGFWLCCCIPFCVRSCKDVEHHCPECKKLLGTYRRV
ncbi:unnamed protein product [Caenorhabditis angaria]|uniref:LITAF domain-containing protein n=1 Tax=Caenorhabditis angaria TaxID=860376 RepID=A0A9P1N9W7_9PELO|nr:unnamed protein product [Caenorhabditis angaria]